MKNLYKMNSMETRTGKVNWQLISAAVLRISIGWHFLFEGLHKVANPEWTAAYFLNNAQGPFASFFQGIAGNQVLLNMADFLNQWGLVAVGLSLMIGLLSRWASLGGMLLLALYYLANPPFIGVDNSAMVEGNYLIVNKNLVELFALWVIFQVNDSKVFGIDRFIGKKGKE